MRIRSRLECHCQMSCPLKMIIEDPRRDRTYPPKSCFSWSNDKRLNEVLMYCAWARLVRLGVWTTTRPMTRSLSRSCRVIVTTMCSNSLSLAVCQRSRLRNFICQCFNAIRDGAHAELLRKDYNLVRHDEPHVPWERGVRAIRAQVECKGYRLQEWPSRLASEDSASILER